MTAFDAIKHEETAVAIFTRGGRFDHKPDGTGSTGNWVITANLNVDKIIIYKQDTIYGQHEVWTGRPLAVIDSEEQGRRVVKMRNVEQIGTTNKNWHEFTGTKKGAINPVKYIKHK